LKIETKLGVEEMKLEIASQSSPPEYIVRLEALTKQFADVLAVNQVSLEVKRSEFITLLGPSGSGKTTIMMMIAGFQVPTSGKIFIEDEMVVFKPPFKRNVGMVFQNYALFPHMTVFENIAFPLKMRKLKGKEILEHVERVLHLVKLSALGGRYPRQLSGGQQQRVALARALVYNPPVLLMDEPLGALDKKLREHMQLEIKSLHRSVGITVIYVTHDQSEALTMSDRIAVINSGRIEQVGTPEELYERPRNKFVADFIGETNFMITEIVGEKEGNLELMTSKKIKILAFKQSLSQEREVNVAIRPERITFVQSANKKLNTYEGIVEEAIYIGDTLKYRVLIENKELIVVTQKNDPGLERHQIGNRVLVSWRPEDTNLV
jgi:putative spermidine/putrescine transport system ATP-binding protein